MILPKRCPDCLAEGKEFFIKNCSEYCPAHRRVRKQYVHAYIQRKKHRRESVPLPVLGTQ
jgi:hypothetical protein